MEALALLLGALAVRLLADIGPAAGILYGVVYPATAALGAIRLSQWVLSLEIKEI